LLGKFRGEAGADSLHHKPIYIIRGRYARLFQRPHVPDFDIAMCDRRLEVAHHGRVRCIEPAHTMGNAGTSQQSTSIRKRHTAHCEFGMEIDLEEVVIDAGTGIKSRKETSQ
jgi:hypothetical protein